MGLLLRFEPDVLFTFKSERLENLSDTRLRAVHLSPPVSRVPSAEAQAARRMGREFRARYAITGRTARSLIRYGTHHFQKGSGATAFRCGNRVPNIDGRPIRYGFSRRYGKLSSIEVLGQSRKESIFCHSWHELSQIYLVQAQNRNGCLA